MKQNQHPKHGTLIDFVESELAPEFAGEIEEHLGRCEACRAFVESVRRTYSALEVDRVPEPHEAFFTYLAGRSKARASRGRRALLWRFLPGAASAAAAVVLMWWLAESRVPHVDSVDIIMADMTTGEIVEAVSADPEVENLVIEDSAAGLEEIESYLIETESIYDLLEGMSDTERDRLTADLERYMSGNGGTSGFVTGKMRKEC